MPKESTILNDAYHKWYRETKKSTVPDYALPVFKLSTKNKERQIKQKIHQYCKWIGQKATIVDSSAHYNKATGIYIKSETTVGCADLIACINGKYYDIEVKRIYDNGRDRQSDLQKEFERTTIVAGGGYVIVNDFMSFYDFLQKVI